MSASTTTHAGIRQWVGAAAARFPALVDGYRWLRHPSWQRAIAADLRWTRTTSRFLRDAPPPAPDAPRALFSLYRDDVFDTKVALVLASALRVVGVRPIVLTPTSRNRRVRRYAAAFGVTDVRARDAVLLSDPERTHVADTAASLLAGPTDLATIRGWTDGDRRIGFHILSTLIRRTFDGSPDLHVDTNRHLLEAITHEVLTQYAVCARVLDELAPDYVLVEEANYAVNGPLVDLAVARDIDVVHTITTWRDDALLSKRLSRHNRRVDARSVASETLTRIGAAGGFPPTAQLDAELDADFARRYDGTWTLSAQNQPATRPFTREEIVARIGLDPDKPTVVVFAHVLWDASLFYGADLFDNYADWLRHVARAAAANSACNWVIKAHPSNVFRAAHGDVAAGTGSETEIVRAELPELPPHVHVLEADTPISTASLYEAIDVALTVRGTPGLEAACFGTPVLTAGTGSYSGLGFTIDSSEREEYLDRLAALPALPGSTGAGPDARRDARRYAHTLFLRRPMLMRSVRMRFDFAPTGWHPLDRNVGWAIDSVAALAASADLGDWAAWVVGSRADDHVPGSP